MCWSAGGVASLFRTCGITYGIGTQAIAIAIFVIIFNTIQVTLPPGEVEWHSHGAPLGASQRRGDDLGREPVRSLGAQPDAPRRVDPGAAGDRQDLHRMQAAAWILELSLRI